MTQILGGDQWMTLCQNEQGILFTRMGDAALVVPLTTDGDVLLITEPSPAYGGLVLYLPCGNVEPGEVPADTANRELQEEIGYRAGRLDSLGQLHPSIKYVECRQHIYLGRDLTPSKLQGDEGADWPITVEAVSLARFEELIAAGRLCDSTVIAALYLARDFLSRETREAPHLES